VLRERDDVVQVAGLGEKLVLEAFANLSKH
jgi:hypothetical protein